MAELDFDKLYKDAKRTQDMLEEESLWFGRGSSEYKNVKEQMAQDMAIWDNLAQRKKEDTNYQISAYELQMINRLLVNQDEMIDTYLENKEEEKKNLEAKGKDLSKTSEDRITAMKRAKTTINTQMSTIDDAMKDLLNDGPAPSTADIKKETESIHKELDDADKGVWFGSGRYNLAKQQFQGIETDWNKFNEKYKNDTPDPGVLQYMKSKILVAQASMDDYLLKKGDEADKEKTRKRMVAVGRGKENLNKMLLKIAEMEKSLDDKPVEYNPDKALADVNRRLGNMKKANEGKFIGSSEYRRALKDLEKQQKLWEKIQAKGKDYKPSEYELKELERLNNRAEKAIDAYLYNGIRNGISGQRKLERMQAMKAAKNHIADQKRIIRECRKQLILEAERKTVKEIGTEALAAEDALEAARKNVHFGSSEYKDARKQYERSRNKWIELENKDAEYKPSDEEIKSMKDELEKTKELIDKYLETKKKKNLDKNPKMKRRVEAMEKARNNVELRIKKLEKIENKAEKDKKLEEDRKMDFEDRVKDLHRHSKNMQAIDKNAARASLAATQKLSQLSQKPRLTEYEKKEARRAMAALVLEERIKELPEDEKKDLRKSETYAKAIKNIADSKEFKTVLPDGKLTPLNFGHYAKSPESIKKITKDFNEQMAKNKKETKKQQEKNKELEKKQEDPQRKIS